MVITGYYCYRIYLTFKAHFTQKSFDINYYNFNYIKPPYDKFNESNVSYFCDRLADKVKKEIDLVDILICAFVRDSSIWIKDILDNYEYYKKLAFEWRAKIDNYPYLFEQDCIVLLERGLTFDDNMGSFVLNEFCKGNINIETFIIFNKIFNFSLDKDANFEYIYKGKYDKYELLVKFDLDKYKTILEGAIRYVREQRIDKV